MGVGAAGGFAAAEGEEGAGDFGAGEGAGGDGLGEVAGFGQGGFGVDEDAGAGDGGVVGLPHVGAVAADEVEVGAGLEPGAVDQGGGGEGGAGDDVGGAGGCWQVGDGEGVVALGAQGCGQGFRACGPAVPDGDVLDGADGGPGVGHHAGDVAAADDEEAFGVGAGEVVTGQGRGGGGAAAGDLVAVDEGEVLAGFAVAQEVGGEDGIQAALAVVGKDGDDLDAHGGAAAPGGHEEERAVGVGEDVAVAERDLGAGDERGAQGGDEAREGETRPGPGEVDDDGAGVGGHGWGAFGQGGIPRLGREGFLQAFFRKRTVLLF